MGKLIEEPALRDQPHIFKNRSEAGRLLADYLAQYKGYGIIVLAIPAGGVPVAAEVAGALGLHADLLLVRKLQIPDYPDSGFGAVGPDGQARWNELLLLELGLTSIQVRARLQQAKDDIKRLNLLFRGGKPYPDMKGRTVILVDDGLGSGFTMLTAIEFVRRMFPARTVVAVPTASYEAVDRVLHRADELVCLNVKSGYDVAEAYQDWRYLGEDDVLAIIRRWPFI